MRKAEQHGAELSVERESLVEKTLAELYRWHPEMKARYGPAGRERCREDIAYHCLVLSESMNAGDANIFLKYVAWGKSVLVHRKVRTDDLIDCLLIMKDVIGKTVSKAPAELAEEQIQLALDSFESFADMPPSCIDPSSSLSNLANSYLEALLSADRGQARKIIQSAEGNGLGMADIYGYVFQPVQREVGRLWQVNQISVAQEHYCTTATEMLMGEVSAGKPETRKDGHFFVGACVAGEQHAIGIRMVTEVMEAQGWRTYLTGANTPTASLVDMVKRLNVDVLGISCTTAMHLPAVRQLIQAVRDCGQRTRVVLGGKMFNEFPGLWKKMGADGFAEDAVSAVRVTGKLVGVSQPVPVEGDRRP